MDGVRAALASCNNLINGLPNAEIFRQSAICAAVKNGAFEDEVKELTSEGMAVAACRTP
ncbi:MAG: hypothetical protein ABWJ97_04780 [Thermoproteus sp.]